MTLRDLIADDSLTVFCNSNEFAESVTYYPHRYYGTPARDSRTITAVVMREQLEAAREGDHPLPVFQVHVHNDSTNGISGEELDTGGDILEFPPRDGEAVKKFRITHLLTQDHGMLVLQCQ